MLTVSCTSFHGDYRRPLFRHLVCRGLSLSTMQKGLSNSPYDETWLVSNEHVLEGYIWEFETYVYSIEILFETGGGRKVR